VVGAGDDDLDEGGRCMRVFGGIDWASEKHDVCLVDDAGRRVLERVFCHDETGIAARCALLVDHAVCRVTLERPDGLLVERLLAAGVTVVAIHPNQVRAARERYTVAGGKSDRLDAFVLAELARTDMHRFRALVPDSDQTKALRTLTRAHEDAVHARVALANQLREQLTASWPGAARIFNSIDSPIALAFPARYPSPADARGLGERRLQGVLDRHSDCGRQTPTALLAKLRAAPTCRTDTLESEARRAIVLGLVAALRPLVDQIRQLEAEIAGALRAHPDGPIFQSFFRDPKTAIGPARLLAEIGDNRDRYPTAASLAADAGMSPVAIESGKRKTAALRRGCDHRLRNAIATLADSTRHRHPWAHATYQRATNRNHDHPRAIRTLGHNWTTILWRCWQDHTPYDPTRHGQLNQLATTQG
jgi:transposase